MTLHLTDFKAYTNHPADYGNSSFWIELVSTDGRIVVGHAERTGVTPPFYPDHPVYKFVGASLPEGLYVWDGECFTLFDQWRILHTGEALATYLELAKAASRRKGKHQ